MVDKRYCMSSYLAFRYIERDDVDFFEGMHHHNITPVTDEKRVLVSNASDIDVEIRNQLEQFKNMRKGVMLSGGMDSAIVASYLSGSDAYTFRFLNGEFQQEELKRAEYYAKYYDLNLHYVDINWQTVEKYIDLVMESKCAPVHSIEPQIYKAALQAKADGIEIMFVGESSDLIFGGMDQLLGRDWTFDDFMHRYIFTDPKDVLVEPVSMQNVFERYRKGNGIDYLKFMDDIFSIESSSSYLNAFKLANLPYYDPYAVLKMSEPLDLERVRNGEPKYLIRSLMAMRYPDIPVPNKVPMPRPVDYYFKDWKGPLRKEFRNDIDIDRLSGNQKWQLWCLERFLNIYDPEN